MEIVGRGVGLVEVPTSSRVAPSPHSTIPIMLLVPPAVVSLPPAVVAPDLRMWAAAVA
jgi:hypothetical protein